MFDQLTNVPDWLGAGVVAAITAAFGYVLKGFIEGRKEKGAIRESERKVIIWDLRGGVGGIVRPRETQPAMARGHTVRRPGIWQFKYQPTSTVSLSK